MGRGRDGRHWNTKRGGWGRDGRHWEPEVIIEAANLNKLQLLIFHAVRIRNKWDRSAFKAFKSELIKSCGSTSSRAARMAKLNLNTVISLRVVKFTQFLFC